MNTETIKDGRWGCEWVTAADADADDSSEAAHGRDGETAGRCRRHNFTNIGRNWMKIGSIESV